MSSPLPQNLETPYEALRAPVRDSPHETVFGLNLTPKRATALEFEPLRATVVQGPFHRCATAGNTTAEQGRGTLVDPEISYAWMLSYPLLHVPCSPSARVPLSGVHRWAACVWGFVFHHPITVIGPSTGASTTGPSMGAQDLGVAACPTRMGGRAGARTAACGASRPSTGCDDEGAACGRYIHHATPRNNPAPTSAPFLPAI